MSVTASMVKELREKSGAGMMDCKQALSENDGDLVAAMDWLRAKGIAKAEKKSGRVAAEGLIALVREGSKAAIVELNSETDFVARNESFQGLASSVARAALESGSTTAEALSEASVPGGSGNVSQAISEAIATIGENIALRRVAVLEASNGAIASYVHNSVGEGLGRIGVLVALESEAKGEAFETFGKHVAMHVAAANPAALSQEGIPSDLVARERAIFLEQASESGKPQEIVEKMVEGRMKKFYQESTLLSQMFVIDPDKSVEQALKEAEKQVGGTIRISGFVRMALGEGIEKEEDS